MKPRVHCFRRGLWLAALVGSLPLPGADILRLIGVHEPGLASSEDSPRLGGLSGLDYEASTDRWVAISDDKSEHGPARGYVLKIDYDQAGVSAVTVTGMVPLRRPDSSAYPAADEPDFESIRLDPNGNGFWHTDEGSARTGRPPFVRHATMGGRFVADLTLPAMFDLLPGQQAGLRPNLAFEGLAFSADGQSLWLAAEGPLWQDGPVASVAAGTLTRLSRLDRAGRLLAQYAYPLGPVPIAPAVGKLADNGVAEILALAENRLLVLERSGRQDEAGVWHFTARLFKADCAGATDVRAVPALAGAAVRPAAKRLLFDFSAPGLPPVDNLEGVSFGRKLANGHDTLVFISDDNFNANQTTQVWVFEVLPSKSAQP